jgi:hypothetical protein
MQQELCLNRVIARAFVDCEAASRQYSEGHAGLSSLRLAADRRGSSGALEKDAVLGLYVKCRMGKVGWERAIGVTCTARYDPSCFRSKADFMTVRASWTVCFDDRIIRSFS